MQRSFALAVVCGLLVTGCGKDPTTSGVPATGATTTAPAGDCETLGLTVRPWDDSGDAVALNAIAPDFTVKTRTEPFTLSEQFTGCDVYLFVRANPRNFEGSVPLWEQDHDELLKKLPENTHLFFVSDEGSPKPALDAIEDAMTKAIKKLGPEKEAWWTEHDRIHYVTKDMRDLDNWVEDYLVTPGWGFGIDRFQRIRDIGSLHDIERFNGDWYDSNLAHVAHEAVHYNYQSDAVDAQDAQQGLVKVDTFVNQRVESGWYGSDAYVDVEIDAAAIASADTLKIDMDMGCDGVGEYGTCPAWDRIATMFLCDQQGEAGNPHATEACQPYVAEVLGHCAVDGVVDPYQTCRSADECAAGTGTVPGVLTCDGFVPAIAADTVACPCVDAMSDPYDAVRTCNADGQGYGSCSCACNNEVSRWITTYHRQGRYFSEAPHALPWFQRGGSFTFKYTSIDPYVIDVDLRFSNEGVGTRPTRTVLLATGGNFDPAYNDRYAPVDVDVPASAKKVELVVTITGHGMAQPGNCAEFCNTQHHFLVNGTEHVVEFPWLDEGSSVTNEHCQEQVDSGTVPNQYGTWPFARSNWCPGRQVDPIVIDVTGAARIGATNTFEYFGDRNGGPYPGGASIDLYSYVVIHE